MKKTGVIKTIFLLAAYICLFASIYQYNTLRKVEKNMENYAFFPVDSVQELTFSELEKICDAEANIMGAYSILCDGTLYAVELSRSVNANIIICSFSVDDIFPASASLLKTDAYGCLVSSESMYQLFGTLETGNQQICINGNDYFVRGVIPSEEEFIVLQYSDRNKADVGFVSGIALNVSDESYCGQYIENVYNRYQFGNQEEAYYVSDYTRIFGRIELSSTSWVDVFQNKEEIHDRIYRKLYGNKDQLACYYYHFTWENVKLQCMIFIGSLISIWLSVVIIRNLILEKR